MFSERNLVLSRLKLGELPGVNAIIGSAHHDACLVCLHESEHSSGVNLKVQGDFDLSFTVLWDDVYDDQMQRSWNDLEDATEWGTGGIAFLLILELTEYTVIRRSRKGTGFDYWLGDKDAHYRLPFQDAARLEVSGILRAEKESDIKKRVKRKLVQIGKSDSSGLPGYVVIVEFSRPVAHVVMK